MVDVLLFVSLGISFVVTYLLTPKWINIAHQNGITGKDMNKYDNPVVAEMGGLPVNAGFLAGVFVYIALNTFYFKSTTYNLYILAAISSCMIIMIVGMLDDILGWKKGLKQWQKPLLTLVAAFPMMVVNAGESSMVLPIVGNVDFGVLYPLIVIPFGIAGAANGFNILAGYNGLEGGMGVLILGFLGFAAWQTDSGWVAMLALAMAFSLLAFLKYNWYPAKIFPGDSLSYSVGALIACVAILGNLEKIAVILFIPYFIDFIIPAVSPFLSKEQTFKTEAFGKPNKDGTLELPYPHIYGMEHLALWSVKKIKGKCYEKEVTYFLFGVEIIIMLLVYLFML